MWIAIIISCGAVSTGVAGIGCEAYTIPRFYPHQYACENALQRTYPEVMETGPIWISLQCKAVIVTAG